MIMLYNKPPFNITEQLDNLKSKSLIISDSDKAEHYLSTVSYARLSIYFSPFYEIGSTNFKDGTTFEHIINLYSFDRALRITTLEALEQIEIAVRSVISNHMSITYNDAFWYTNVTLFSNQQNHKEFLKFCQRNAGRNVFFAYDKKSNKEIVKSSDKNKNTELYTFYDKYENKLPPSWLLAEALPMGSWSKLYANLKESKDKRQIAKVFGFLLNDFESWLRLITLYRNCIAHHRRFWNEDFSSFSPKNEKRYLTDCGSVEKIYKNYLVIFRLLQSVTDKSDWKEKLRNTLEQCPFDIHTHMNFPVDWDKLEFWTKLD